ncbi:MAG: four helix bundle protein [Candidatus Abawacabacteria bacterium]|nr:four helix bundle protein [Candidatus Abawacabacteria bacterium]
MKQNIVKEKSYKFVVSIFPLYRILKCKREYDIVRQLWRSSTSIGANIEEAVAAYSRADFGHKLTIALKEARETRYWLNLLKDIQLLTDINDHLAMIESIISILTRTVKTLNSHLSH